MKYNIVQSLRKEEWENFVYKHPGGNIFQTPEMYEVYKRTKHYEPILLAVKNESNEIFAIVLAVIEREFSGILGIFNARSSIYGGPLIVNEDINILELLLKEYDKIILKKALYTLCRNFWDTSGFNGIFKKCGYRYEEQLNFLIDLKRPPEMILSNFKRDKKRAVKKADKLGLDFKIADSINEVESFYKILLETYRKAGIPLADKTFFLSMFDQLCKKDEAKLFIAKINDDIIAGRFVLCYKTALFDWYAGAKSDSFSYHPNEFLVWCVLKWGAENGYHVFDFGGAGNPSEEYGVREFKKQFGGQLVNFGRYKKIHSPKKLWFSMKMFEMYRRIKL